SANDMPPRSSLTTCIGWYSPSASVPPKLGPADGGVSGSAGGAVSGAGAAGAGAAGASPAPSVEAGAPGVLLSGVATSGAGAVLGPSCSNIGCLLLAGHETQKRWARWARRRVSPGQA